MQIRFSIRCTHIKNKRTLLVVNKAENNAEISRDFYNVANFLLFIQYQYFSERHQHSGSNNNLEFRFFSIYPRFPFFFDFASLRYTLC